MTAIEMNNIIEKCKRLGFTGLSIEELIESFIIYLRKSRGDEEVERQVMSDIVGKPLAIVFYLLGFRGSYHRMGGTAVLEKFKNGTIVEKIEAPAMWEQMCFKKDRIR